jgi:hypothetical protein
MRIVRQAATAAFAALLLACSASAALAVEPNPATDEIDVGSLDIARMAPVTPGFSGMPGWSEYQGPFGAQFQSCAAGLSLLAPFEFDSLAMQIIGATGPVGPGGNCPNGPYLPMSFPLGSNPYVPVAYVHSQASTAPAVDPRARLESQLLVERFVQQAANNPGFGGYGVHSTVINGSLPRLGR